MMKIVTVVGARPQFIKMGPLSRIFKKRSFNEIVVHTGQHYDDNLSDIFFKELGLFKPKYNLGIKESLDISQISLMLTALGKVFIKEKPGLVLTYGDTNSALACALAGSKLDIPVAHVEAGVRGFDRHVPEEINRLIIDRVSTFLFCPTKTAVGNLKREGIEKGVFFTGDVMAELLQERMRDIKENLHLLEKKEYILVTLHRQENVDRKENLKEIVNALTLFKKHIVFPVHPRTEKNLKRFDLWRKLVSREYITILKPQGYYEFLNLEKNAEKVLTDSGGVQKEAYILKIPCITLRTTTEWPETLENGWNRLIPCRAGEILKALYTRIQPGPHRNIFGRGKASQKIFDILLRFCLRYRKSL